MRIGEGLLNLLFPGRCVVCDGCWPICCFPEDALFATGLRTKGTERCVRNAGEKSYT